MQHVYVLYNNKWQNTYTIWVTFVRTVHHPWAATPSVASPTDHTATEFPMILCHKPRAGRKTPIVRTWSTIPIQRINVLSVNTQCYPVILNDAGDDQYHKMMHSMHAHLVLTEKLSHLDPSFWKPSQSSFCYEWRATTTTRLSIRIVYDLKGGPNELFRVVHRAPPHEP